MGDGERTMYSEETEQWPKVWWEGEALREARAGDRTVATGAWRTGEPRGSSSMSCS
jgi:hypothetical protein